MLSPFATFREKNTEIAYTIFRVFIGLLFMFHGMQKMFGLFTDRAPVSFLGSGPMTLFGINLMWFAGVIELLGGILVALGLLTVVASALSCFVMIVAYVSAHAPKAFLPVQNGGEMALLYLVAFLYIAFRGSGKYSLDALLSKNSARSGAAAKA